MTSNTTFKVLRLINAYFMIWLQPIALQFIVLNSLGSKAQASNPGVSYQGRIYKPDGHPLEGSSVQFRMQIRSPGAENCLLFEEIQSLNMLGSSGVFSITLNDGSGTRVDTPTYQLDRIFANRNTMTLDSSRCTVGTSYTPNTGDGRKLVVYFKDETMADFEPVPIMNLGYSPQSMYALESQKVGSFGAGHLLRAVDGSGNPVTAPAFDPTQLGNLNDLIAGTSTQYTTTAAFSVVQPFAKASLPACGIGEVLKANGTTLSCVTDSTGGGGGTVTSVTSANAYLVVATGTSTPDLTLNVGTTANTVAAGNDSRITGALQSGAAAGGSLAGTYPNPSFAAGAITNTEVSASAAIADSKLATISTAGKVSGGAITSGTIGGSTVVNTSGNIQTSGAYRAYDSGPTNYVGFKAPASVPTSYDLVFPNAAPATNGYLLSSDTSGNLSWVAPNSGSVTSVTATAPVSSTGGVTPVISMSQANTTTAGYLSSADWNTFNDKQGTSLASANIFVGNAGGVAAAVTPSGDVTMTNTGSFTVTKIQGSAVSGITPTLNGQLLRFNGAQWVPNFVSMFDLRSTITGATTFGAGCTSGQTLTWTSATDNLSCTNIAINDSQISNTVSRTANTFLAAPNGSAGAASYRGLASGDLPSISSGLTGTLPADNGGTGQSSYTVGDLLYASTTNALSKLPASTSGYVLTSNGAGVAPSWAAASSGAALSGLSPATATNSINNSNFTQTWNWNSATTENPMSFTANALTTGSVLNLTTSSASINSTNGLLNVANTSATNTGVLVRFQSNSTAGSGMTVLANGKVGVGTTAPVTSLDLSSSTDGVNMPRGTTAQQPTCSGATAGNMRYNSQTTFMEYCDGSVWNALPKIQPSTPPTAPAGAGYIVMSNSTWNGGLGGRNGADAKCLTELSATYTNWAGYADANSRGLLISAKVKALLCDASVCTNMTPLATYTFAVANQPGAGGASMTADATGVGPNDNAIWSAANRFNGSSTYWTGRAVGGSSTAWPSSTIGSTSGGWTDGCCSSGTIGNSGATDGGRWSSTTSGSSGTARLICLVNP